MGKNEKKMRQAFRGVFSGPTNADLKQDTLSRLQRHFSGPGGDDKLEREKLQIINAAFKSLDDLVAGSEHVDETSGSRSQDELAQVRPPWSAFAADLPRRLELLKEMKNAPFRKMNGTWEPMDEKDVTPHVWAAFQVAPIEALEDLLRLGKGGYFAWEHMDAILRDARRGLWRLVKLCNSGIVPELEPIEEGESSLGKTSSAELEEGAPETPPPGSPPKETCLVPTVSPIKGAKARTMERDGGVCAVTGTPDAEACYAFPFPGIRHADTVCHDLRLVGAIWGYGFVEKIAEAIRRGAKHLDSPKNMISLNHYVRRQWDRAHATLEPASYSKAEKDDKDDKDDEDDEDDGLVLHLRWRNLPQVRRLGKRKRPFQWTNDLAQDPMEVLDCLNGSEGEPLRLFHTQTLRPILDGHEVVVKAAGEEERPDVWLWRLRHMVTCMTALIAAATPEGVGEEDSEMDDRDRQLLIRMWAEKTEGVAAGARQQDDSAVSFAE